MVDRFMERAQNRDPVIEQDLAQLYFEDSKYNSLAALAIDEDNFR